MLSDIDHESKLTPPLKLDTFNDYNKMALQFGCLVLGLRASRFGCIPLGLGSGLVLRLEEEGVHSAITTLDKKACEGSMVRCTGRLRLRLRVRVRLSLVLRHVLL